MSIEIENFEIVKQQKGDKNCLSCVAAMITGYSAEYVHKFLQIPIVEPITDSEFLIFLLNHGYSTSIAMEFDEAVTVHPLINHLSVDLDLEGQPAYIRVKGSKEFDHAILWTGYKVLDPSPYIKGEGDLLQNYEIYGVYPLKKSNDLEPRFLKRYKELVMEETGRITS
jgi:hypothetical protein